MNLEKDLSSRGEPTENQQLQTENKEVRFNGFTSQFFSTPVASDMIRHHEHVEINGNVLISVRCLFASILFLQLKSHCAVTRQDVFEDPCRTGQRIEN